MRLDEGKQDNYRTKGKTRVSFQESEKLLHWSIDAEKASLTSGLTRVKPNRDYCVKLDIVPLSSQLSLTGIGCLVQLND